MASIITKFVMDLVDDVLCGDQSEQAQLTLHHLITGGGPYNPTGGDDKCICDAFTQINEDNGGGSVRNTGLGEAEILLDLNGALVGVLLHVRPKRYWSCQWLTTLTSQVLVLVMALFLVLVLLKFKNKPGFPFADIRIPQSKSQLALPTGPPSGMHCWSRHRVWSFASREWRWRWPLQQAPAAGQCQRNAMLAVTASARGLIYAHAVHA